MTNFDSQEGNSYYEDRLRSYLELDPDNLFREAYIENRPDANFRFIARQRLDGSSWWQISESLEIPITTLISFFWQCLERFASQIGAYLDNDNPSNGNLNNDNF